MTMDFDDARQTDRQKQPDRRTDKMNKNKRMDEQTERQTD